MEDASNHDDFLSAPFSGLDSHDELELYNFAHDQSSLNDIWSWHPPTPAWEAVSPLEPASGRYDVSGAGGWNEFPATHSHDVNPLWPDPLNLSSMDNVSTIKDHMQEPSVEDMGPPRKRRKTNAPTLHDSDWEPYKDRIIQLHITQNLSLNQVKEIMEIEHRFTAEIRQYRLRISQWKLDKNIKPKEMKAIVKKRQERRLVDVDKRELRFRVRGSEVDPQKIDRWMKRHNISDSATVISSLTASTPSAVSCQTKSESRASDVGSHDDRATVPQPLKQHAEGALAQITSPYYSSYLAPGIDKLHLKIWDELATVLTLETSSIPDSPDILILSSTSEMKIETMCESWANCVFAEQPPRGTEARDALALGFRQLLGTLNAKVVYCPDHLFSRHFEISNPWFENPEYQPPGLLPVPDSDHELEWTPFEFSATLFLWHTRKYTDYSFLVKFRGTVYDPASGKFRNKLRWQSSYGAEALHTKTLATNEGKNEHGQDEKDVEEKKGNDGYPFYDTLQADLASFLNRPKFPISHSIIIVVLIVVEWVR